MTPPSPSLPPDEQYGGWKVCNTHYGRYATKGQRYPVGRHIILCLHYPPEYRNLPTLMTRILLAWHKLCFGKANAKITTGDMFFIQYTWSTFFLLLPRKFAMKLFFFSTQTLITIFNGGPISVSEWGCRILSTIILNLFPPFIFSYFHCFSSPPSPFFLYRDLFRLIGADENWDFIMSLLWISVWCNWHCDLIGGALLWMVRLEEAPLAQVEGFGIVEV